MDLAHGTYRFHGRDLRIWPGRLLFDGPLDNPSLDIVAAGEYTKVEPGVRIGGDASHPLVDIIGETPVPDADYLAPVAKLVSRLASRLSATCEQGLLGVWNIVKLQYELAGQLWPAEGGRKPGALD